MPTQVNDPDHLSPRQAQLCATIDRLAKVKGYSPSLQEVADEMGIADSGVFHLARSTEQKGALTRVPGVARSWRVVKPASATKVASKRDW
jgi:SOS-response transcriptional repressor LexA